MEYLTAVTRARKLLRELGISKYPVDVESIAAKLELEVIRKSLPDGQAGRFVEKDGRKIIVVNETDIDERQRFTVLHEVAHRVLGLPSKHGHTISEEELFSYRKRQEEEVLCDAFAAEILVPWNLLKPLIEAEAFSVPTINALSRDFKASRMCTASRFAQCTDDMAIYLLSEDGFVRNVIPSKRVREAGFWVNVGIRLPKDSAAMKAIRSGEDEAFAATDGVSWSSSNCASRYSCDEAAIVLPRWNQAISMLTLETDQGGEGNSEDQFDEEDELLAELTGELPWRKG